MTNIKYLLMISIAFLTGCAGGNPALGEALRAGGQSMSSYEAPTYKPYTYQAPRDTYTYNQNGSQTGRISNGRTYDNNGNDTGYVH